MILEVKQTNRSVSLGRQVPQTSMRVLNGIYSVWQITVTMFQRDNAQKMRQHGCSKATKSSFAFLTIGSYFFLDMRVRWPEREK